MKNSLKEKINNIVLFTSFSLAILFLISFNFILNNTLDSRLKKLNFYIQTIFNTQQEFIANELFSKQYLSLKETLDNLTETDDIISAQIFSVDGDLLLYSGEKLSERLTIEEIEILQNNSVFKHKKIDNFHTMIFCSPILIIGENFGYIQLYLNVDSVFKNLFYLRLIIIIFIISIISFLIIFLNTSLNNTVIKPILTIKKAMDMLGKGVPGENLPEVHIAEIDDIINTFNLMSHSIILNNNILEQKVRERTSELLNATDSLIKSEEKYRLLTESSSDVIWVLNLSKNKFSYISPSIYELRGLTPDEAMQEKMEDCLTPESLIKIQHEIAEHLDEYINNPDNKRFYINEIQQPKKNGEIIWVEISTKFRFNKEKEIEVVGVSRNIEARKKLEQDLILAKETAEHANKAKSEFLANMSHEIRTPLNAIIGYAHLMSQTELNSSQQKYIDIINKSGNSLLLIINDILDFSKIEAGKMDFSFTKTDIKELLKETIDVFSNQAKEKNISLNKNLADNIPEIIKTDPLRLKQILTNLISNAVKFTHEGEVSLNVYFEKINDNKGIFKFSIKDTGIGIKKDERERMFQAFTQADGSTTRKYGGTGLGLTISNMLLSKLNSHIEFESEPDKGSEFFFEIEAEYFTKEKKETLSEKIEPENLTQNFSYSKILIAEDYEPNFLLLEALISKKIPGSEIIKATNGKEAYEKTFEFYPDIILMDVQMPEMDGIEATKTIRANADTSDITIIALTAHAFENEKEKCLEAGMNDFISKPVDINTVIEKIIYYLNNGATE